MFLKKSEWLVLGMEMPRLSCPLGFNVSIKKSCLKAAGDILEDGVGHAGGGRHGNADQVPAGDGRGLFFGVCVCVRLVLLVLFD